MGVSGVLTRVGQGVALWVALSLGLFYLVQAVPGSPEEMRLGQNPDLSAEALARLRAQQGLDLPTATRYRCWLLGRGATCPHWPSAAGVLGGDLGWSRVHQAPVATLVGRRMGLTLALMGPAFGLSILLSVLLGSAAARRPGGGWDRFARGLVAFGLAVPAHWLALLLVLGLSVHLRWFPAGGVERYDAPGLGSRLHHLALPVLVLSVYYVARWTRFVREALGRAAVAPYLDAARAKGLSARAVWWRHALPNALFPLLTVVAQSMPVLFSGALVVERVFAYPGMGLLVFESVEGQDDLVAVTVFLIYAALTFVASALADLGYAWLDPRARERTA